MARDDWFRNKTWNEEIEAAFCDRLRRARDKSQYLRIQASYLTGSHPEVALDLLDQYFGLGDHFDMAQAYVDRANALVTVGDVAGAISSYEAALERERQFPSLKTQAYLGLACLVVETRAVHRYAQALEILDTHRDRLMFPVDRYRANGARALMLQHFGQAQEARAAAVLAVAAADETESGFRYHQHLGLVEETDDTFAKRIKALAA